MLRLIEEETEGRTVGLRHDIFDLRLLEEAHVAGRSLRDDFTQSLVARRDCAVDMVGGLGELGVIPGLEAGALVLLDAQVLETGDIVVICDLVHLSMNH